MELSLHSFTQQSVNALTLGGIYALIAVGYTMVYGIIKLINFAHGEIYMVGAFSGVLLIGAGVPLFLALPASMVICALLGILIDWAAYKRLRRSPRLAALITAIGMSLFLQNLAMLIWSADHRKFPDLYPARAVQAQGEKAEENGPAFLDALEERLSKPIPDAPANVKNLKREGDQLIVEFPLATEGAKTRTVVSREANALWTEMKEANPDIGLDKPVIGRDLPYLLQKPAFSIPFGEKQVPVYWKVLLILAVTAVFMIALEALVKRTRVGIAMRACSLDQQTAALMGIDVNRIIALTFAIGSAMAAAAGILYALNIGSGVNFRMGYQPGFIAFSAAVLGGIGNIRGAVLGGFIFGIVDTMAKSYIADWLDISGQYSLAFAFAILILVILIRPTGLLGSSAVERA